MRVPTIRFCGLLVRESKSHEQSAVGNHGLLSMINSLWQGIVLEAELKSTGRILTYGHMCKDGPNEKVQFEVTSSTDLFPGLANWWLLRSIEMLALDVVRQNKPQSTSE